MSSRDDILRAVAANKPAEVPGLPEYQGVEVTDILGSFVDVIETSGAVVVECPSDQAISDVLKKMYPPGKSIVAEGVRVDGATTTESVVHDRDFADVDLFVCRGKLAVAENGAIWLTENECVKRIALFLAENVAVVVDRATIVGTMHDAYERIVVDEEGWAVFVAGPSKTADIEQSLVIGAHGPRSLVVFIV